MKQNDKGQYISGKLTIDLEALNANKAQYCVMKMFDGRLVVNCGLNKDDRYQIKLVDCLKKNRIDFIRVDVAFCLNSPDAINMIRSAYMSDIEIIKQNALALSKTNKLGEAKRSRLIKEKLSVLQKLESIT